MSKVGFLLSAAFGTGPYSTTPNSYDLSTRIESFSLRMGRPSQLDQFDPGQAVITLANHDGALNPSNTAGPYWPYVQPRVGITLLGYDQSLYSAASLTVPLFSGFSEAWRDRYSGNNLARTDLTASDAFALLATMRVSGSFPQQISSSRVEALLNRPGTTLPLQAIGVGKSSVQAATLTNANALEHLRAVSEAEGGYFYVTSDGYVAFSNRHVRLTNESWLATFCNVPNSTYGDGSLLSTTTIPYESIQLVEQDYDVRNDVVITPDGSTGGSSASDTASIATFGVRSLERSGTLHESSVDALAQAQWIVSRQKTPYHRVQSITSNLLAHYIPSATVTQPHFNPLYTGMSLEPQHRVRVVHKYPGSTKVFDQIVFIDNRTIEYDKRSGRFSATWGFSPGDWEDYWVLNSTRRSVLGATTRLTY